MAGNNVNAYVTSSSNHSVDMTAMKADTPFTLKSSTTTTINGSRLIPSNSNERLLLSQNEDSISSSSFLFEENASEPRSAELFIIESHTPICVSELYRDHFFEYFHINYYGEFDHEGPFIASLRYSSYKDAVAEFCEARVIVRTPYRNCNVSDKLNGTNENNILQMLFHKVNLPPIHSYGTIGDPKANEKIYLFDKANDERFNCKIGFIYQRLNQTDEYNIFSNDYPSNDMIDFLEILADRVRLKGFSKYRGDLDTKDDLHGEYSYYTVFDNHEIMFNIAPLIPSTKANGQCIERKGLVGNAFVCIVFQEAGAIFSPDFISGKVTQIYITVQPTIYNEQIYYKIGIWHRNDIKAVIDPPGGTYKNDASFLSYFLTLLLNSANVAIESPSLRSRVYEQRQRLKYEELKKLCHSFSLGPIPDFTSDTDSIHYQMEMRPSTRSESLASNITVTTSDSGSTNPNRGSPVSSKKRGLSKKIFGVFSSRSASISSPSVPSNHTNNDGSPGTPQPSSTPDTIMGLTRINMLSSKESSKPTQSLKTSRAPIPPSRSSYPQTISIQPPTPSFVSTNPFITDKSQSVPVSTIDEEDNSTNSPDDEDSEDESSEDDETFDHPRRYS